MLDSAQIRGGRRDPSVTILVPIDPDKPHAQQLAAAAVALERGGIIAIPTETSYGLAADSGCGAGLRAINALKRKPPDSPLLLLAADLEQARSVMEPPSSPLFEALARQFWPGPLTLVVNAAALVSPEISSGRRTVALRVPGLTLPRRLAATLGRPVTGVSANLHGQAPCHSAQAAFDAVGHGLALVLDGGPTSGGLPSTLVDLTTKPPRVLRIGAVPVGALAPFLDCV